MIVAHAHFSNSANNEPCTDEHSIIVNHNDRTWLELMDCNLGIEKEIIIYSIFFFARRLRNSNFFGLYVRFFFEIFD